MTPQPYIEAQISIPLVWMKPLEAKLGIKIGNLTHNQLAEVLQTSIASVDYNNEDLLDDIRKDAKIS
jgi:hypothetical protein